MENIFEGISDFTRRELTGIIEKALHDVFTVELDTAQMTVYKSEYFSKGQDTSAATMDYSTSISSYLKDCVLPQEVAGLHHLLQLENIIDKLKNSPSISYYYRVIVGSEIQHMRLICTRVGDAESFNSVLFTIIPQDVDVRRNQLIQSIETDDVTGVYTKQAFIYHAETIIRKAPTDHYDIAVVDIQNFRMVNSIFGYEEGNKLLNYLGQSLVNNMAAILVGRYAGDQFILLMESKTNKELLQLKDVSSSIIKNSNIPFLVLKYGIYRNIDISEASTDYCDKAMLALNSIKHNVDHDYAFYDKKIIEEEKRKKYYRAAFEKAVQNKEFKIWCQPQHDAVTGSIVSAEALVRWNNQKDIIFPLNFIPYFEKDGNIVRLDEYVFDIVCSYQRAELNKGNSPLPISVNVSRVTILHSNELNVYRSIISKYDLPMELVPLEITETSTASDRANSVVSEFREAGFRIHMDDFGSGYSSLASLSDQPTDVIKLDKSLIDKIGDARGDVIIRHMIEMSHSFDSKVIAEGVETVEQLNFLNELACDYIQGHIFNKAMPYEEYLEIINA